MSYPMFAAATGIHHVTERQFKLLIGRHFELSRSHVHQLDHSMIPCPQYGLLEKSFKGIKPKQLSDIDQMNVSE